MLNKKGGIAIEEIRGIMTFMFIALITLLVFYGCSVSKTQAQYTEFKFSKDEIEASKSLHVFLEKPFDEERKYSDVIVEACMNDDYSEVEEINIEEYFSNIHVNWQLYITYHCSEYRQDPYTHGILNYLTATAFTTLPVLKESEDMWFVDLSLEVYGYVS